MVVRLGYNYYDKTPLIGKIVDINIWDRWDRDNLRRHFLTHISQTFESWGGHRVHQLPQLCPHPTRSTLNKKLEGFQTNLLEIDLVVLCLLQLHWGLILMIEEILWTRTQSGTSPGAWSRRSTSRSRTSSAPLAGLFTFQSGSPLSFGSRWYLKTGTRHSRMRWTSAKRWESVEVSWRSLKHSRSTTSSMRTPRRAKRLTLTVSTGGGSSFGCHTGKSARYNAHKEIEDICRTHRVPTLLWV